MALFTLLVYSDIDSFYRKLCQFKQDEFIVSLIDLVNIQKVEPFLLNKVTGNPVSLIVLSEKAFTKNKKIIKILKRPEFSAIPRLLILSKNYRNISINDFADFNSCFLIPEDVNEQYGLISNIFNFWTRISKLPFLKNANYSHV